MKNYLIFRQLPPDPDFPNGVGQLFEAEVKAETPIRAGELLGQFARVAPDHQFNIWSGNVPLFSVLGLDESGELNMVYS